MDALPRKLIIMNIDAPKGGRGVHVAVGQPESGVRGLTDANS